MIKRLLGIEDGRKRGGRLEQTPGGAPKMELYSSQEPSVSNDGGGSVQGEQNNALPDAQTTGFEQHNNKSQQNAGGGYSSNSNAYYSSGSFEDYYERLISALKSYGISMALPTLGEIYDQLSAFLRPSVDAAINERKRYGDTVMAELDADAYSRGMGGSSYLSGMKNREYNSIASDIASLETNYSAKLSEYLYNASNELAAIQSRFAEMAKQHELEMQRQRQQQAYETELRRQQQAYEIERQRRQNEYDAEKQRRQQEYEMERRRQQQAFELEKQRQKAQYASNNSSNPSGGKSSGGKSSGGKSSGGKSSGKTDGYTNNERSGSEADYYGYTVYFNALSEADRYKAFNSNESRWQRIREELRQNLTSQQYEKLRREFDPGYGKGSGKGPGPGSGAGRSHMLN